MARGFGQKNIVAFNAGEWSPKLDGRIDLEKYALACKQLQNFTLLPYGGAVRRPGLQFLDETNDSTTKTRLIEFQFSTAVTYVLEIAEGTMRVWKDGSLIESGGSPLLLEDGVDSNVIPWVEAELFEIQSVQINDVMYLVHPNWSPLKLIRLADDNWTVTKTVFDQPPFLDENITNTTITPTFEVGGSGDVGEAVTLAASSSIFEAGHVGSYWEIRHLRESESEELNLTGNGSSTAIPIIGEWQIRSYGYWSGTVLIERSLDGGTSWEVIRKFIGDWDRNIDATGEQESEALLRIRMADYSGTLPADATFTNDGRAVIEAVDAFISGIVRIDTYTSGTSVAGEIISPLEAQTATEYWSEGAWSDVRGYPRAISIFEQRIVYAGSTHQPQTIWASVTGDYENFRRGTADADSLSYTIGSQERNQIEWIVSQNQLLIGTSGGEWALGSGNDEPLTPSNVIVKRQSTYGSKNIQAKIVNEVVLMVQRNGKKVREVVFSFERDGYVAPDLTLLAEHITGSGIVQIAYQQQPDSILWAVTGDGKLIGMTYERDQNVVGWHRHITDGSVESVAVVYGDSDDEVWVCVNRTVEGSPRRYIERFNPTAWTEKEDAFFVDSGLTFDGGAPVAITGITNARPPVVTSVGHPFSNDQQIVIRGTDIPEADNKVFTVKGKTADTFQLYTEDGSGFADLRLGIEYVVVSSSRAGGATGNYILQMGVLHPFVTNDILRVSVPLVGPFAPGAPTTEEYLIKIASASAFSTSITLDFDSLVVGGTNYFAGATISLNNPAVGAYTSGGTAQRVENTFVNLSHLEGKTVKILSDGAVLPDQVVSGGAITATEFGNVVHVGLGYESILQPMKLDVDGSLGPSMGQVKQIRQVVVRMIDSLGLTWSDGDDEYPFSFRDTADDMDESAPLFSGDKTIDINGPFESDGIIILKQDQPLPTTILALVIKYQVTGN